MGDAPFLPFMHGNAGMSSKSNAYLPLPTPFGALRLLQPSSAEDGMHGSLIASRMKSQVTENLLPLTRVNSRHPLALSAPLKNRGCIGPGQVLLT